MVFSMEHPIRMDDLGVPQLVEMDEAGCQVDLAQCSEEAECQEHRRAIVAW